MWPFVSFFLISILVVSVQSKIYERCDLINELVQVHGLSEEAAAKLACVAEVADFDTGKRVIEHTEEISLQSGIVFFIRMSRNSFCEQISLVQISTTVNLNKKRHFEITFFLN